MTTRFHPSHITLALLLVVSQETLAGAQSVHFSRLGIRDGLSQSAVTCIFQDSRGFMWFGTQDGLNRFDGYTFSVYKHNPSDPKSINDNFIYTIAEDRNGELWIVTQNRPEELNRYDRTGETFTHRPADSVDLRDARMSSVLASTTDRSGNMWTGSGKGLVRMNPATAETTSFKNDPADPRSLSDNRVYSVYCDRSGTIWVGTRSGLNRFDPATGGFVHYRHDPANARSLSDDWVWPILEDASGVLWVGTFKSGLNRFDRSTGTFTHYRHNTADPSSLSNDEVLSLYQDRSGLLWVGTNNDGLNTFHPDLIAFEHFSQDPNDPASLLDNNVISLLVDRTGSTWVGTRGGLSRLDRRTGVFRHFVHVPGDQRSLAENAVSVLLEDRAGMIWTGTFSSGLDRFNPATEVFTHYRHSASDPSSLSDNRVVALLEDHEGVLWVGTYGGGLNRFDRTTGRFTVYTEERSTRGSISAAGAWALMEDRDSVLWVGTFGGGLNRFDRRTGTFTVFRHDKRDSNSISDDIVLRLHEDRSGVIWAGTTAGLNRFDRNSGTFKRYRQDDGMPNDVVLGILEDDRGHLWISTNAGLARFDPRTETFRIYDERDGLQGNEFNQNAYAENPLTGEMCFGGGNGFNIFHPDSVRDNPFIPPVVFSAFRRYNTDDIEGKPIDERGIAVRREITLTYKDNIATFEFAALSFLNPLKNQYAYQLEGFSDSWIQLGNERRATFTNLDPGEYTLRVRGSNNDGVWNTEGTSLSLLVTPPWWRTTWAYGIYTVLFLAALYGIRSFEIKRREQKALVRESQLRAKAVEAEKRVLEVENERKTKELEEARHLQLSMLPQEVPRMPQWDIAVFTRTATEVGGDYYDFHLADDTLHVAFGDATGHGMQAGTIVTLMKGMFTSDASRLDIKTFFNHCSRSIKGIRLGRLLMAFSLLKITGGKVTFSCAGMPPLFFYRKRTNSVHEVLLKGMPLGAMKNFPYVVQEETLEPGDTLLLLTDGLPEQKNAGGEMFDYSRVQATFLEAAARTPDEIIRHLVDAGDAWMGGVLQEDDITVMVLHRTAAADLSTTTSS